VHADVLEQLQLNVGELEHGVRVMGVQTGSPEVFKHVCQEQDVTLHVQSSVFRQVGDAQASSDL